MLLFHACIEAATRDSFYYKNDTMQELKVANFFLLLQSQSAHLILSVVHQMAWLGFSFNLILRHDSNTCHVSRVAPNRDL